MITKELLAECVFGKWRMKKELGSKKINEITYRNRFSVLLSRKNNQVFLSRKICSFFVPVFKNPG